MADPILYFQEGDRDKKITVTKDEFIIGRFPDCDLQLSNSGISRHHTRLLKTDDNEWMVEDMGSKNGTKLNNNLLKTREKLKDGDIVQLETFSLKIALVEGEAKTTKIETINEELTLIGDAEDFQQQWIEADTHLENIHNFRKAIDRLKDLVEIAKVLNRAESIEAIFSQVREVVFRELKMLDRLALLVDVDGNGELELINAIVRDSSPEKNLPVDGNWISSSICRKVFAEQVAIKTDDAQTDARFEGEMTIVNKGIRTALAVPLWDKKQVFGVLYGDALISYENWHGGGEEDLSFFSALGNIVASSVQRWLLSRKLTSEEMMRHRLERYHSPAVVQQLLKVGLSDGRLIPVEADISILFADIVGFTALSERLSASRIAELLNNLFEEMLKEVFAMGGTLDKFIGDCIMAFFGAPEPQVDHAERAVLAANKMLARLQRLNANNVLGEELQLRISVNSGKAVVGDVGSSQRVDYTVLGPTINLAARMEPTCPPGHCVISENTYELLRSHEGWETMGEYRFKGIDRPVRIYKMANSSVLLSGETKQT